MERGAFLEAALPTLLHSLGNTLLGCFLTPLPIFLSVFNDPIGLRPGALPPQGTVAAGSPRGRAGLGWDSPGGGSGWGPELMALGAEAVRGAEDGGLGSRPGGGRRGRRARAGHAAGGVRGEGAGGGQRAGSRRGVSGYAAQPSHPQLGRGAPGGLGPSPAVCISLAGGGAWVERNRLHLERCLFFLTSQRRQTTPKALRPDPAEPSLGRGSGPGGRPDERGGASLSQGNAPGSPPGRLGGRVAEEPRKTFFCVGKPAFSCRNYLRFDLAPGGAGEVVKLSGFGVPPPWVSVPLPSFFFFFFSSVTLS